MNIIQLCFIFGLVVIVKECSSLTQSPPRIVKQPPTDEMLFQVAFQSNENPKPFIIECEAEGEPAPKYRWIKNGKKFDWQAYDDRISQQPGRGTLVISLPRDEDLGQYQCFAENEWGIATSNSVFVRKSELNSFKDQPRLTLNANEGEPLKVECRPPDGWPKPKVNWMMEYTNGIFKSINNSRMTVDPEGNLWFSNVTRQDSSEDNFSYACTATSHFRSEYKVGNRVLLKVEKVGISAALNKHEPVQQYVTRKNEVVLRGKQVELFCIFGGTPLPHIVWSKDGRILSLSDRVTQENYGKTLVIKHANFEDQGSYTCDASNGVGSAKSYSISLKVMAVPYFTVEPEIKNAAENETVEIKCEASGVPTPQIKWIHNGKPIVEAPPNDRRVVGSNSIIIRKLEKSDTGNYGCNATNSLGYVYKDVYINVLAQAPEISEPPGNVYTVDGRNVEMKCHVFGAPKPIVKWIREGREMTGGRYTVSPLGDLLIKDVNFQDVGEYTCLASNKFGEAKEIGTLTVKEHTRITDEPEDYEVAAGTQATFRCNAVTDPSLNISIEWLYDGQPIDFDAEPRFVKTNDYSLTITRTTEQDSGTYTCEASTDLDNATAQATLTVQDVPNPPKLESIECLNREAKLSWRPMGDSRAPILRFIIQYNTSFTPDTWESAFDSVPATDLSYNVGLSPWANYTFRVAALNKIGPSLPSHHSEVCTTTPDVPYKNPDNVEGKGTEPHNMIISWSPMPQIEHNAPRFQYRIYYKRQIPGEEWITEDIFDWNQSELLINNLPTFQPYDIKVVAINQKGQSNVTPVIVTGYSGEDSPTQAPTNFTLVQVTSSNAALLSWNPVSPESVRGHFKGYKIQTWTAQGGENDMREIHVKADANKTLVMKFVPFARNYARILAYNGRFNGPPSETLSFETPEGTPGTVADFQAYPMGSSALFLIWTKPTEPNGILTGYKIYYSEVTQTALGTALERKPQITDPRQTRAKLAGLKPNTKYRVTITATTRAGEGDPYFLEETTRSGYASAPDIPIFTLDTLPAANGLANVQVTWLPSLEGRSGSHFNVKYRIKGEPEYISTPSELAENWIILRGLFPGEVYEVVVVAYDGEYFTESPPQDVDTSGVEGPFIQVKENVASAGWFIGAMLALAFLLLLLVLVCVARRNRGGKYDVHDRELANGRHDFVDEGGFHEYSQPLDNKSRHSMSSGTKHPESDTDSMAEYGEGETAGMNEDGSFIGQYGRKRRQPPGGGQPDSASQAFATLV